MDIFLLPVISFAVAVVGSLIGAGGGFLLMPVLMLIFRDAAPEKLTFISLFAVFVNAASALVSYARARRVDFRSGLAFGLCTIPAAVIGAKAVQYVKMRQFSPVFGLFLATVGLILFYRTLQKEGAARPGPVGSRPGWTRRVFVDSLGHEHKYAFSMPLGLGLTPAVGFVSSFFGIGGGIIHVPIMTQLLHFPTHVATATSIMVLAMSSLTGIATHVIAGRGIANLELAALAGLGALFGARLGVRLSYRVSGRGILIVLACALLIAGGRLIWQGLGA